MINWIKKIILIKQIEKLLKELLMDESRWTSRKFFLVVGVLITTYALVWKGMVPWQSYLEFAKWVLTAYLAVNLGESVAQKFSPNGK